jgi:hypothetical protein
MREFIGTDELKNANIRDSDLSGAQLRGVNFSNVKITDAWLFNTDISGAIGGLKINGVAVEPLVEAELDRRYPERTKLRPKDVDGLHAAFDVVEDMWAQTVERARRLPQPKLHERVGGEYSFVETLRHLIFATDAWLVRLVLRVPNAYHEWAVPPDLPPDAPPDTGPGLDAVLDVRAERMGRLRDYLSSATEADLSGMVSAPDPTGHPQGSHRVLDCFLLVLREEWWHNWYAARDLAVLERG